MTLLRKRQRPSALDYFDAAPEEPEIAPVAESQVLSENDPVNPPPVVGVQINADHELLAECRGRDPVQITSLLIRGGKHLSADEHARTKHVYVFSAADHAHAAPVPLHKILGFAHIAKILWGPGRREICHALSISHGQLKAPGLPPMKEMYMISFVSPDAAEKAAPTLAYLLNQFLATHQQPLSVEAQVGSRRWWVENEEPWNEAHWHGMKKSIPHRLPMPKPKMPTHKSIPQKPQRIYEVSQLPKWFTVELMIKNLIDLELPRLPIEMKFTEEPTGPKPVRMILRFDDFPSSILSKFKLMMDGIKVKEDQVGSKGEEIVVVCFVDDGDGSMNDPWQIWTDPVVWTKHKIKEYALGIEEERKTVHIKTEDEMDELESVGTIQGDAESEDGLGPDGVNNVARGLQPVPGIPEQCKELERIIAQLTVECEADFPHFQQRHRPNSAMYDTADQASYERKLARLSELTKKRKMLRRQAKKYKQRKGTPVSVKRLRKEWRRQQQRRFGERVNADAPTDESDEVSSEVEESSQSSEDENDVNMTEEQWQRSRRKKHCREIMHPRENESDEDDETHPKRIWMHDELYRIKHARPDETEPKHVD